MNELRSQHVLQDRRKVYNVSLRHSDPPIPQTLPKIRSLRVQVEMADIGIRPVSRQLARHGIDSSLNVDAGIVICDSFILCIEQRESSVHAVLGKITVAPLDVRTHSQIKCMRWFLSALESFSVCSEK